MQGLTKVEVLKLLAYSARLILLVASYMPHGSSSLTQQANDHDVQQADSLSQMQCEAIASETSNQRTAMHCTMTIAAVKYRHAYPHGQIYF